MNFVMFLVWLSLLMIGSEMYGWFGWVAVLLLFGWWALSQRSIRESVSETTDKREN